jgi:hypothetical protein
VSRRRARRRARTTGLLTLAGLVWWAWANHPAALILVTILASAIALGVWRARAIRHARAIQDDHLDHLPTDTYQHWFAEHHIAEYLAAGWPREIFGYTGLTVAGRYNRRCLEHAGVVGDKPSWWWPLVDQRLSTRQGPFANRDAAEAHELAEIARLRSVGNIIGNPDYRMQTALRESLRLKAERLAMLPYAPAPSLRPPVRSSRRLAYRGAR